MATRANRATRFKVLLKFELVRQVRGEGLFAVPGRQRPDFRQNQHY